MITCAHTRHIIDAMPLYASHFADRCRQYTPPCFVFVYAYRCEPLFRRAARGADACWRHTPLPRVADDMLRFSRHPLFDTLR